MKARFFARRNRFSAQIRSCALLTALAAGGARIAAQDTAAADEEPVYTLEPIVVTAQKREQAAIEVPISMSVYDGALMDQLQIQDMAELSAYVPGFEAQLQSPNNPGFAIRGITTDSGDAYEEPRVSVFLDGVSISKSRGSAVELFDMERIEVLKGPQSTLFGRGASSGAFSLITHKPQNETSAKLTIGGGNLTQYHADGYYNTPLVEETVLLRVAASYRHRDGFIDNLEPGADDDLNGVETIAVRPSLRYLLGGGGTFDLSVNYQYDDYTGTSFLQKVYAPEGRSQPDVFAYGQLNRGDDLGVERTVWGATGTFTQPLGANFELTSITAYREFDAYEEFDADGTQAYLFEFAEDARSKQWSQELRVNWEAGSQWEGFFGGNFFYQDAETRVPLRTDERILFAQVSPSVAASVNPSIQALNAQLAPLGVNLPLVEAQPAIIDGQPNLSNTTLPYGMWAALSIQAQLAAGVPPTSLQLPTPDQVPVLDAYHEESYENFGEQSAYELFGDTTWKITDQFSLTGGLRFTYEDIESGYRVDPADPTYMAMILREAAEPGNLQFAATDGKMTASESYTSVVGRLVAAYQVTPDFNTYASYSRGRRPAVITITDTASDPHFEELDAETLNSYEIGFKSFLLERRVQLESALFYYQYNDFATSVIRDGAVVTESAGDADALGAEVSFNALLMPGCTLFGNYGWIDGQFNGEDTVYEGNTFRLTPRNSFALGLHYQVNTEYGSVFVAPSYTWKSRIYFTDDPNEKDLSQDSYGLLNLRAGLTRPNWQLAFYVKNALDEAYLIDAGNTGRSLGLPTYIAGTPRLYGLELTIRL
ncbi:MAG: TonB-dependent receptor [Puniceicoccaceae bacterium 5H]|nr:MAG: TonB-dependent receptor [Puniceicoccaceae bacterium 5H]